MFLKRLALIIVVSFLLCSCVSNKRIYYLQNTTTIENDSSSKLIFERFEYRLQIDDQLLVNVKSSDPKATGIFNNSYSESNQSIGWSELAMYFNSYSVNDSGFVELPVIGKVKVVGLTLKETKKLIEVQINKFFINSYLTVKLNGVRFALIGEFRSPGKFVIYENQVTIFEAVSQGGDLSSIANRKDVILLRHYPDGAKTHHINLLDKNILKSPYYFVQTNDVIYVKPLKVRELGTGVTAFQTFQAIVAIFSIGLLVANLIK